MTQQNEDKGKTTGTVQDEQARTKPTKGELRDEELEKATGGDLSSGQTSGQRQHKPF